MKSLSLYPTEIRNSRAGLKYGIGVAFLFIITATQVLLVTLLIAGNDDSGPSRSTPLYLPT
jgi:hypothetical protein